MILPTKYTKLSNTLLGIGAKLLVELRTPKTVSMLWECVRDHPEVKSFSRFVLALDFLYALGAIEFKEGILKIS